jgi:hypothetical protein
LLAVAGSSGTSKLRIWIRGRQCRRERKTDIGNGQAEICYTDHKNCMVSPKSVQAALLIQRGFWQFAE